MPQRKLIWFAIFASTLIYFIIVFIIAREPQRPFNDSLRLTFTFVLYGAALVTYAMSYIAPARIAQAQPRFIVRLALTEAVAIYGLLAAFLAHDWRLYIAPWAVAFIGFLQAWPSAEEQ
ncbi:MAG TPA: hypothetical protein VN181_04580 [Thermoanaerobaculia bacterium]|nr:hypothetical protein [Thermoanaerobaculia bacterium]